MKVKKIYLVISKFYNSGKVCVDIVVRHFCEKGLPLNYNYETSTCDVYCDYFDTFEQAQEFANQARNT